MESMAQIHEAEIRENGETEIRQRKETGNNEPVEDIEEEDSEVEIERSTIGEFGHFWLQVFEDIVDQSDVDDKKGLKWYQLTAMTIQGSIFDTVSTSFSEKIIKNHFEAIFYCASFYFICVMLEDKKILSRVFDVSEDMGVFRESKQLAVRN